MPYAANLEKLALPRIADIVEAIKKFDLSGIDMAIQILMPALSPTMTEGRLAKWLKKEGDPIASGDVIAEIETDKAMMEYEAVDEGRLGKILIGEGDRRHRRQHADRHSAARGRERGRLARRAAAGSQARCRSRRRKSNPAPKAETPPKSAGPIQAASPAQSKNGRIFISPLARRLAKERSVDLAALVRKRPAWTDRRTRYRRWGKRRSKASAGRGKASAGRAGRTDSRFLQRPRKISRSGTT